MDMVASGLFIIAALINLAPLVGVLGQGRLEAMYGVPLQEPDAVVLMRHRAVLFGLLGGFMLWAVWAPELRVAASVLGLLSMLSFLVLARLQGPVSQPLRKIVVADVVGIVALVGAIGLGF